MLDTVAHVNHVLSTDRDHFDLLVQVDLLRRSAGFRLEEEDKARLGQFLTPAPVARLMASMLAGGMPTIAILDAGAGVGTLFAACVAELCGRSIRPAQISVTAYEIDTRLAQYLPATLALCQAACERVGIRFTGEVLQTDFIRSAVDRLAHPLFSLPEQSKFNCAVLNPPYRKIHSDSASRKLLQQVGIETSNLYTGFLALTVQLLEPGGELVAITPRSFCNGPYFKSFRRLLLRMMTLRRLHLFESRQRTFRDDNVLQENVILHAIKGRLPEEAVAVTTSVGADEALPAARQVPYERVVQPGDPQMFIHIVPDAQDQHAASCIAALPATLSDLGLQVSTGRVVDFRAREFLRAEAAPDTAPLIFPAHFTRHYVTWPKPGGRKPNALLIGEQTRLLLVPNANYVLVRRFSSKEEKKRIVAAVYEADRIAAPAVGFENHLNYFHHAGQGLDLTLAKGLAAFLNSTLVDSYFRQFNGHTQVNATDLRHLRYPTLPQLNRLGIAIPGAFPPQDVLDALLEQELFAHGCNMPARSGPALRKQISCCSGFRR